MNHSNTTANTSCWSYSFTWREEVKEAFYLQLEAILAALPSRDMLVLLGDFNAQVGTDPEPYGGVMGPHGFGKQQPFREW